MGGPMQKRGDIKEPEPDTGLQILKGDSMRSALLWLRPQSAMRSSLCG